MAITRKHVTILLTILEKTYIADLIEKTFAMSDAEVEGDLNAWGIDLDKSVEDFTKRLYYEYAKRQLPVIACGRCPETVDLQQSRLQWEYHKKKAPSTRVRASIRFFFEKKANVSEEHSADILAYLEHCYSHEALAEASTGEIANQLGWAENRVRSVRTTLLEHNEAFGSWLQAECRRTTKIAEDAEREVAELDAELLVRRAKRGARAAKCDVAKTQLEMALELILKEGEGIAASSEGFKRQIAAVLRECREILERVRQGDVREKDIKRLMSLGPAESRFERDTERKRRR